MDFRSWYLARSSFLLAHQRALGACGLQASNGGWDSTRMGYRAELGRHVVNFAARGNSSAKANSLCVELVASGSEAEVRRVLPYLPNYVLPLLAFHLRTSNPQLNPEELSAQLRPMIFDNRFRAGLEFIVDHPNSVSADVVLRTMEGDNRLPTDRRAELPGVRQWLYEFRGVTTAEENAAWLRGRGNTTQHLRSLNAGIQALVRSQGNSGLVRMLGRQLGVQSNWLPVVTSNGSEQLLPTTPAERRAILEPLAEAVHQPVANPGSATGSEASLNSFDADWSNLDDR